jgi:hypothetical protein
MLAKLTNTAELELEPEEAARLAEAIERVDVFPSWLSEKQQAWVNLTIVAGTIYGPRLFVIRARHAREEKEKKGPAAVVGIDTREEINETVQ